MILILTWWSLFWLSIHRFFLERKKNFDIFFKLYHYLYVKKYVMLIYIKQQEPTKTSSISIVNFFYLIPDPSESIAKKQEKKNLSRTRPTNQPTSATTWTEFFFSFYQWNKKVKDQKKMQNEYMEKANGQNQMDRKKCKGKSQKHTTMMIMMMKIIMAPEIWALL